MKNVFFKWDFEMEFKPAVYVGSRCSVGDVDACTLLSVEKMISENVVVYRNDERVLALLDQAGGENQIDVNVEILSTLRRLGFDVNQVGVDEELAQGLLEVVLQRNADFMKRVIFLRVSGHALPFVVPGFISIRSDGSVGGTVVAPQWLVPRSCFFGNEDAQYVGIKGIGTFGVDSAGLLVPAPLVHVDEECELKLPETVVVRFVDAPIPSFSLLYNDFVVYRQRNAVELREVVADLVASEKEDTYVSKAVTRRLSVNEALDVLHRVRDAHPGSSVAKLISVVKAIAWLRENAQGVLTLMMPRMPSSSGMVMRTERMAKVMSEYVEFLRKVAMSANPPPLPNEKPRSLSGGFVISHGEAYWLRKALSELVGLRVRLPYVTPRGAFIHEATIKRVAVWDAVIEVIMDNGLRYRLTTYKPRILDLINFAALLGDERVRETFMKALERVSDESARVAMFLMNVEAGLFNMNK